MTSCRVPDCGATTDGVLCRPCGQELRRALQNHRPGDPDIPTLLSALSQAATGSARVYRANRRPGQPDQELSELEAEIGARHLLTPANLRSKDGRVTLPATSGVVNLAARDLLDEAWNALTTTVRHLCETRGVEPPELPTGQPASERVIVTVVRNRWRITREPVLAVKAPTQAPRQLADWLADRVNSIRYDQAGPEIHHELTRLRERLVRAVDRGPSRVYAGPCEAPVVEGKRCQRPLYATFVPFRNRRDKDDDAPPNLDDRTIVCDGYRPAVDPHWDPTDNGCGAEHTASDRREWLIADLADRLYPIKWWAYWLPLVTDGPDVPYNVIMSWGRDNDNGTSSRPTRARLIAHGLTRDAEETYKGQDVMDLMAQYRPKKFAQRPNRGRMSA